MQPRISGLRGIFIGVDLIRTFLKKTLSLLLALLMSASIMLTCISEKVSADGSYNYSLSGSAFIKGQGHTIGKFTTGILTIGETQSGKGIQALSINLHMLDQNISGSLQYRIYISKKGWQDWTDNSRITGISTMPRLITGIQMRLTGDLAQDYSIWYSAWTPRHKDLEGWVCDSAIAGSPAENKRIEQIQVMLVRRNRINGFTGISFRAYMQKFGWDKKWAYSNHVAGRAGKKRRLEGLEISMIGTQYTGNIRYRCRIAGSGWRKWAYNGEFCGRKSGKMEAIEIQLTGELAEHYDIYYRTYSGGLGWFNWARNGEASGSAGIGRHIEAIQIALKSKNSPEPGALNKIKSKIGYKYVSTNSSTGLSEWRIGKPYKSSSFGSAIIKRARYYNRTEYKDMRCDALVAQVLTDVLGTTLGRRKGAKYTRLNEWIGLSALESLLSSTFTYKDRSGRIVICRPVAKTKLKKLVKKTWKRKEKKITEEEFNTWVKNNCVPGDILIFYNKKKKPIHCGIYSGVQSGSAKEYEYFHGKNKGETDTDKKPGHYMWHSGYDTGVANKYAFWVAEVGRSYYVKRFRVDSGKSHPAPPVQKN